MLNLKPASKTPNLGLNVTLSIPATPVVTTADSKAFSRIDFSNDDSLVDSFIEAATLWVQKRIGRALINQTVIAEWDSVGDNVPLPYIPVSSITKVETVEDDGTLTELTANSGYYLRNGKIKVTTSLGLRVTYIAGYGTTSTDVPTPLVTAVERIALGLYERRDDEVMGDDTRVDAVAMNSLSLLQPYMNYASI